VPRISTFPYGVCVTVWKWKIIALNSKQVAMYLEQEVRFLTYWGSEAQKVENT